MTDKLDLAAIEARYKRVVPASINAYRLIKRDVPALVAELRACGKREHELHGELNSMQFQSMLIARVDELEAELRAERARVAELETQLAERDMYAAGLELNIKLRVAEVAELEAVRVAAQARRDWWENGAAGEFDSEVLWANLCEALDAAEPPGEEEK